MLLYEASIPTCAPAMLKPVCCKVSAPLLMRMVPFAFLILRPLYFTSLALAEKVTFRLWGIRITPFEVVGLLAAPAE
ncbi:hypothetical protein D3C85_1318670 [compost metagenome]